MITQIKVIITLVVVFSASDVNSDSARKTQILADEGFISLIKSQQDNVRHVGWFVFPHPRISFLL